MKRFLSSSPSVPSLAVLLLLENRLSPSLHPTKSTYLGNQRSMTARV